MTENKHTKEALAKYIKDNAGTPAEAILKAKNHVCLGILDDYPGDYVPYVEDIKGSFGDVTFLLGTCLAGLAKQTADEVTGGKDVPKILDSFLASVKELALENINSTPGTVWESNKSTITSLESESIEDLLNKKSTTWN